MQQGQTERAAMRWVVAGPVAAAGFAGRGLAQETEEKGFFPEHAIRVDQVMVAQRAWIAFRDANCAMAYGMWGSGSMRYTEGASCLMQKSAEQTIALRAYRSTVSGE